MSEVHPIENALEGISPIYGASFSILDLVQGLHSSKREVGGVDVFGTWAEFNFPMPAETQSAKITYGTYDLEGRTQYYLKWELPQGNESNIKNYFEYCWGFDESSLGSKRHIEETISRNNNSTSVNQEIGSWAKLSEKDMRAVATLMERTRKLKSKSYEVTDYEQGRIEE